MSRPTWWLWLAAVSVGWTSLYAQGPPPEDEASREDVSEAQELQEGKRRRPDSPYEAYDAGLFDEALQGFVDSFLRSYPEKGWFLFLAQSQLPSLVRLTRFALRACRFDVIRVEYNKIHCK